MDLDPGLEVAAIHLELEIGITGERGCRREAGDPRPSVQDREDEVTRCATVRIGDRDRHRPRAPQGVHRYGSDQGFVNQQGWWVQTGYKLAGLNLEFPVINNVELMGRYDNLHNAPGSNGLGANTRRYTTGFIYYFTNTLLFEGDYEFVHSNDLSQLDQLILQLSYGF